MPSRLPKPCRTFGCNRGQHCQEHGRKVQQQHYDSRRGSAHARGYTSTRWSAFRRWYLDEQVRLGVDRAGLCGSRLPNAPQTDDSECARRGQLSIGNTLDHIIPVTGKDAPRFYDVTNLQLLGGGAGSCGCHDRKRQSEVKRGIESSRPMAAGRAL